jgi:hypothetical protein
VRRDDPASRAARTDDRELYTPFVTAESALVDAALLLHRSAPPLGQQLRRALGILVESAENASAPRQAWVALARAANLLDWQAAHHVADDLPGRIHAGLRRSVEHAQPLFSVWGYDERTEAGRHCYVYHHALDYLLDRSAPIPFRLGCAMAESLHAWEADMLEMDPDVRAVHEVTPSWSPTPVAGDVMSSHEPPFEAEFDTEDLWVLDDVASRWTTIHAARERLLTFRMANKQLSANNAPVPADLVRRLLRSAAAVGSPRRDR